MVRPSLRSRSFRKLKTRLPGGEMVVRFRKKRDSPARCSGCRAELSGVPRETDAPKTKKRPERPFGGILCPSCSRNLFRERARAISAGSG